MRTITVVAFMILMSATAAQADSDFSFRIDLRGGSGYHNYYGYDDGWYPGYGGYWGGAYQLPPDTWYFYEDDQVYHPRYQRHNRGYQSIIKPYEPLVPTHPSDRPGYHIYNPRPTNGPPELYGDYRTDAYGYPIATRQSPYTLGGVRYNPRHRRGHSPVAYGYSYGYLPYYQPGRYYTAPAYPQYGYYRRGVVYQQLPYGYEPYGAAYRDNGQVDAGEINIYEGDVYQVNYDGSHSTPPPTTRPPGPPVSDELRDQQEPREREEPQQPREQAVGARFYDQLRLETAQGPQQFVIEKETLSYVARDGAWHEISTAIDPDFGGYGAWLPEEGSQVIYREGDRLYGAYPLSGGDWLSEALPYDVDFGADITVGLVGGAPWVVFNDLDGTRYVVGFSGHIWFEIGSGSAGTS